MKAELTKRLAPLIALLDAKYFPLLFAVAPQSYAVYLWLWRGSERTDAAFWFAVMGAIGYEAVYVGAIAWAEHGESTRWTWATAGVSLIFSIAVAVYVYLDQGLWSMLHAGFPLVAFCYTITMHVSGERAVRFAHDQHNAAQLRANLAQIEEDVARSCATLSERDATIAQLRANIAQKDEAFTQLHTQFTHTQDEDLQAHVEIARLEADLAQACADLAQKDESFAQLRSQFTHQSSESVRRGEEATRLRDELTQERANRARMEQESAQQKAERAREAERLRVHAADLAQQLRDAQAAIGQRDTTINELSRTAEIDLVELASKLKENGLTWRDIEGLLGISQSTLRSRLKARTNGHLQEA